MRYRGLKKVTHNNVIKIDGNNQNIYNKLNMLIDMYGRELYRGYFLFFNYQYDFSDLILDITLSKLFDKKNDTKVCNSYVLIYEGEDNYNYECGLSEKIAAQEDLFMNKQSLRLKLDFGRYLHLLCY